MIRRLIILLLIVGCAPTKPPTANFYIGMTEEEFLNTNNLNLNSDGFFSQKKNNNMYYQRMNDKYLSPFAPKPYPEDEVIIVYTESERQVTLSPYYFIFENDSLVRVSKGILNFATEKEIDYEKYATPPE